ncbi:ABC transporter permease subunit [Alteromonas gilva]|uniref:ABC transporter permease subunit n=1 Tax=Alteromonas gilva TaxID=2987522 RepID=A0ABT5KZB0_9ALTE|nr:ABC transporter permease subunit [Alteromonas gilva]MDC8830100.1 ABC transporter permease subunit [Alteromonas gilva]
MNVAAQQASILKKRYRRDKIARYVITAFGFVVLLTMVILIWHLFTQASGVIKTPSVKAQHQVAAPEQGKFLYVGDVSNGQAALVAGQECGIWLARMHDNQLTARDSVRRPCSHTLGAVTSYGQAYVTDVSASGQVRLLPVPPANRPLQHNRVVEPAVASEISFALPAGLWERQLGWQLTMGKRWIVMQVETADSQIIQWINRDNPAQIIRHEYAATQRIVMLPDTSQIVLINGATLTFVDQYDQRLDQVTLEHDITWADTIVKNRSLYVGLSDNTLMRLSVYNQAGVLRYQPTYTLSLQAGERPLAMASHASTNGLALVTDQHQLLLINRVSGDIVQRIPLAIQPTGVSWFDSRLYVYGGNNYLQMNINDMGGLTTFNSLFAPQVYEGYPNADQIWQTSSATDYQETKMSLMPLLIGSLKASSLALLIAIPLAFGAAVYTAYFAQSRVRDSLKPTIEMLEAVPSVLIGFIAAIWLAPLAERFLFSFAVFLVTLPVMLLLIALVQHRIAESLSGKLQTFAEVLFPTLGILLFGYVCVVWAPELLLLWLGLDDFTFFANAFEVPVGKTTILVAIALGLAISPSIYSLAEDAISGVPASLKQASYALGATRLQTLRRVVLHVALPGIVAAVMLGFGRAFGETMIVLMVTGNTPIADWDLLAGLRALTANLAIELPEAEVGNIHYQVLFLTACILFSFTFVVNTLAELLRQRLRKVANYG